MLRDSGPHPPTRDVNEVRTLEAQARTAEARTLEAEARALKAEATQFWP